MNTPKTDAAEKSLIENEDLSGLGKFSRMTGHARQLETQVQELREALEKIANVNYSPMGYGDMQHAIKAARAILEKTK